MSIRDYLRQIGRGSQGARALTREQAADLMGLLLDGCVGDLEVGAFCAAMRIKGETAEEMAGFVDAAQARLRAVTSASAVPIAIVVLPSYNGARKLPVLTPLLAALLAQAGVAVLVHGLCTEPRRVSSKAVLAELGAAAGVAPLEGAPDLRAGQVTWADTGQLHGGLARLLSVREVVGLRNSAHSLVKLINPCAGRTLLVTSYTHPEYRDAMLATLALTGQDALLLRGTEGEPVADPRRTPAIDRLQHGVQERLQEAQTGSLTQLPELPGMDAADMAAYTLRVLRGELHIPLPIACQVRHILSSLMRAPMQAASSRAR